MLLINFLFLLRYAEYKTSMWCRAFKAAKSSYFAVYDAIVWLQWPYTWIITTQLRGLIVVWVLLPLPKEKGVVEVEYAIFWSIPPGKHLSCLCLSVHPRRRQLFVAMTTAPLLTGREKEMVRQMERVQNEVRMRLWQNLPQKVVPAKIRHIS